MPKRAELSISYHTVPGAILCDARLSGTVISGAAVSGALFSGAVHFLVQHRYCNSAVPECIVLQHSLVHLISNTVILATVLSGAVLSGVALPGAALFGTELSGVALSGAALYR